MAFKMSSVPHNAWSWSAVAVAPTAGPFGGTHAHPPRARHAVDAYREAVAVAGAGAGDDDDGGGAALAGIVEDRHLEAGGAAGGVVPRVHADLTMTDLTKSSAARREPSSSASSSRHSAHVGVAAALSMWSASSDRSDHVWRPLRSNEDTDGPPTEAGTRRCAVQQLFPPRRHAPPPASFLYIDARDSLVVAPPLHHSEEKNAPARVSVTATDSTALSRDVVAFTPAAPPKRRRALFPAAALTTSIASSSSVAATFAPAHGCAARPTPSDDRDSSTCFSSSAKRSREAEDDISDDLKRDDQNDHPHNMKEDGVGCEAIPTPARQSVRRPVRLHGSLLHSAAVLPPGAAMNATEIGVCGKKTENDEDRPAVPRNQHRVVSTDSLASVKEPPSQQQQQPLPQQQLRRQASKHPPPSLPPARHHSGNAALNASTASSMTPPVHWHPSKGCQSTLAADDSEGIINMSQVALAFSPPSVPPVALIGGPSHPASRTHTARIATPTAAASSTRCCAIYVHEPLPMMTFL